MASFDFPTSPVNGQTYTLNGVTYYYSSAIGAWLTNLVMNPVNANTSNTQIIFNDGGYSNGSTGLIFNRFSNTFTTNNATINGNLGVGTNNPSGNFHVANTSLNYFTSSSTFMPQIISWNQTADANGPYFILQKSRGAVGVTSNTGIGDTLGTILFRGLDTSGNQQNSSRITSVATAIGASSVDSSLTLQSIGATGYLTLATNSGEVLRANGTSIGIGITIPAAKLHVKNGNILADAGAISVVGSRNAAHVSWTDNAFGFELHYGYSANSQSTSWATAVYGRKSDTVALRFGAYAANEVAQGNLSEYMTILNTGNVGIGTTAPGYKLDVNGNANVNGTMVMTSPFTMRNRIINGAMEIGQRGTTFSGVAFGTYTLDRWVKMTGGTGAANTTMSQISSTGLTGLPYALRYQRNSGSTSTGSSYFGQIIESANMRDLAGQTITFSFYARAGANYSGTSNILSSIIAFGSVADEGYTGFNASTWTGITYPGQSNTLTTSWQRFTQTLTVPSNSLEMGIYFNSSFTGTAGAADYYDITGIQVELGSVATPFERRPYGVELALCQRYFCKTFDIGTATGTATVTGWIGSQNGSTGVSYVLWTFPVRMRGSPTMVYQANGTGGLWYDSSGGYIMTPSTQRIGEHGVLIRVTGGNANAECAGHAYASIEL